MCRVKGKKKKRGMVFVPYDYEAAFNKNIEDIHEYFVEQMLKNRYKCVYTRLENAIYAAREALQMAQETSERINAAEALREAAEAVRVAQEKAREIKESQREDRTAAAVKDCIEATQDAIEKTAACVKATEAARKVVIDISGLNAILNEVKDYYERIRALETDINITIDGGTAKSREFLLIDGGTAFSTDYDKYNAGRAHTI